MNKQVKSGDTIKCNNLIVVIDKIFYQDYYNGDYDIEFIDTNNNYRHYKSFFDGGTIEKAVKND